MALTRSSCIQAMSFTSLNFHIPLKCGILHIVTPQVKVKHVYLAPTKLQGHSEPRAEHRPVIIDNYL